MPTSTVVTNLTYVPPLATTQQQVPFSNAENYVPHSVGVLDIPVGVAANTAIAVPFGTVSVADVVIIKNNGNQDLGLRINGIPTSPAILYQMPPGGVFAVTHPTAPGSGAITSVELDTTVTQATVVGTVDFYVFGAT
jgi:hypothetical protein